ncbi:alpha/beta fold hydrolase [Phormidium tenue FACHB-886]|nr:alpha/beta fold hydrolase [Phormidium tenue FACHB-886]
MFTSSPETRPVLSSSKLFLRSSAANELANYASGSFRGFLPTNRDRNSASITQNTYRAQASDLAGNNRKSARQLGILANSQTYNLRDKVGKADPNDFYTFTLGARSNFRIDLFGLGNNNLKFFSSNGINIFQRNAESSANDRALQFSRTLDPGTYYIQVNQSSGQTNYRLELKPVNLAADIENKGLSSSQDDENLYYKNGVNLYHYDQQGRTNQGIVPNKKTVVVIHGRGDSSEGSRIKALSKAVAKQYNQNYQVLALDWESPADDSALVPFTASRSITPVAQWASQTLKNLGITKNEITLLGHSLGSYVGAEIGRLYGKVKHFVALDPAFPAGQYDLNGNEPNDQQVGDFEKLAQQSLSLVVQDGLPIGDSAAGDNDQASTSKDSLLIRYNGIFNLGPTKAHNTVIDVFRDALSKQYLRLENNLALPRHLYNSYNRFGKLVERRGSHEGRILATRNGKVEKLIYVDREVSGKRQQSETWK